MRLLTLALLISFFAAAQDTIKYRGQSINVIDANGKKTGLWKIFDDKKDVIISFQMDKGELVSNIDYYKSGKIVLTQKKDGLIFYDGSKRIYATRNKSAILLDDGNVIDKSFSDLYWSMSEISPMFYGGHQALTNYIVKNLDPDRIGDRYGRVIIRILLDVDGKVESAELESSDNPNLNYEVRRVLKSLPRFQPGMQTGQFVRVVYSAAINFSAG